MPTIVYSFPKSGNFFATRALAASFELNPYYILLGEQIIDLHKDRDLKIKYYKDFLKLGNSKQNTQAAQINNYEGANYLIYKTHNFSQVIKLQNQLDAAFVIIRKPTDIIRSHTQFQYLKVAAPPEGNLLQHAKFVYQDQCRYMNQFSTLRSCLETRQDSYLEVIFNALHLKLPVFIVDYANLLNDPAGVIRNYAKAIYSKTLALDEQFAERISKNTFLTLQEEMYNHIIKQPLEQGAFFCKNTVLEISSWAYQQGFRPITRNNQIAKCLRSLPACKAADAIYDCIKAEIPSTGLFLNSDERKQQYLKIFADRISAAMIFESKEPA
ncbi:MAG: hypothetical protein K0U12_04805 [Gammaproteobacteria bacterium]|nr:hypothetical protein [Gammaproteobacteria bacterium]